MTLTEFLLERIAEDETMAEEALDRGFGGWEHFADLGVNHEARSHIARHHPARVLAECAAKRRIVEGYVHIESFDRGSDSFTIAEIEYMERILPALASVYADHPDYDEEWRP